MNSRLYTHILLIAAAGILATARVQAQPLQATATISRDSILTGEPLTLKLQVTGSDTALNQFEWFSPADTFAHFEILEKSGLIRTSKNNHSSATQEIIITSFDSGRWEIPAFTSGVLSTPPLPVFVNTVPVKEGDQVKDIKEIILVKKPFNYLLAGIIAAGVLAILVAWWRLKIWLSKKVKKIRTPAGNGRSPYEEAIAALQHLEKQPWLQNGQVKAWHTELERILKQYLGRQSGLSILEQTSKELRQVLRSYRLPPEISEQINEALSLNETVKFAKHIPAAAESVQCMLTTKNTIAHIHQHKH